MKTKKCHKIEYRKLGVFVFFLLTFIALTTQSCKKDNIFSNTPLSFSVDTLVFDTVFTTVGSVTKRFKIYNNSNRPVKIDQIYLAGGNQSKFRFNLDGESGLYFENVEIPRNDSLFAFVEVTLDPNGQNLPMIIEDSVVFLSNSNEQRVVLAAWGQDAYFHYSDTISGTLPNDKPHVIYNYAMVPEGESLTIQAGTKVHFHNNGILYINKGQLFVEGTMNDKVVFEGDRLEESYANTKGQYYGIYFEEALPSVIEYAIIKNGTAGIHITGENENNSDYTLKIYNSELYNHNSYGIFNYSGGKVYGENLLLHNNNAWSFFQLEGGSFNFRHCHFLGYGTDGNQPAIAIKNYFTRNDGITYVGEIPEGNIYNSVIYGTGINQIAFDTITDVPGGVDLTFLFESCLIKLDPSSSQIYNNVEFNSSPNFIDIETKDFKHDPFDSPINNAGNQIFTNLNDILGIPRTSTPDLGPYEIN